jgi:hypothetical protein
MTPIEFNKNLSNDSKYRDSRHIDLVFPKAKETYHVTADDTP